MLEISLAVSRVGAPASGAAAADATRRLVRRPEELKIASELAAELGERGLNANLQLAAIL